MINQFTLKRRMEDIPLNIKKHWLGKNYMKGGVEGNDIEKTNVPDIRVAFREDALQSEKNLVKYYNGLHRKLLDANSAT